MALLSFLTIDHVAKGGRSRRMGGRMAGRLEVRRLGFPGDGLNGMRQCIIGELWVFKGIQMGNMDRVLIPMHECASWTCL